MAIAISLDRPVLTATNTVNENIEVGTAVASGNDIDFKVFLDDLTIPDEVIAASADINWVGTAITATGAAVGAFANVKVGDVVSSATGHTSSQTVTVVTDSSNLIISAIADADGGNEQLTFQAGSTGDLDSTLYHVKLTHSVSGSILTVVPRIYCHDGSNVFEGSSADNSDDVLFSDGTAKTLPAVTINLDDFLTNARVPRT